MTTRARRRRLPAALLAGALVTLSTVALVTAGSPPAFALDPVNPVVVTPGDPANSGFLVFVEGDVTLRSDESEGTLAMGGDLHVQSNYNVAAGSPPARTTYTAPGDARPTYLHVGGGIGWDDPNAVVNVENGGFTKVADTSTYDAFDRDSNNAAVDYRLVPQGRPFEAVPHIQGRSRQTPASIGTPVPTSLIDIPSAFATYRDLTQQMAQCPVNVPLLNRDDGTPLPRPVPSGANARVSLTPGVTNVLTLSALELGHLSEITFSNPPTASTPLLVNVTGSTYLGNIPNLAGVSGSQAPYMLWNFPDATRIVVNGGATIEGTLYAPNARLTWIPTQNIEGNVIAAAFDHGLPLRRLTLPREVHDFPFSATLSCTAAPAPGHLTLVKEVVNDVPGDAEPSDWTLSATGPTTVTGPGNDPDVTGVEVPPGDYALAETDGPDGFVTDGWTCVGGALADDVVTVAPGADVTCTIVNEAQPDGPPVTQLTLVKEVVNDEGGHAEASDWTLVADGPTGPIEGVTDSPEVTERDVDPGDYDLSESGGPPGYTPSGWTCTEGSVEGSTVTLEPGDQAVCTIVNNDRSRPRLTLVKDVVNDDGGTATAADWTLTADGPTTPVEGVTGDDEVTRRIVDPGEYVLSETGPVGYDAGPWECTGGTLVDDRLTLDFEDDVTCTIVNDDRPPTPAPTPSPAPPSIAPGDAVDVPGTAPTGAAAAPAAAAPAGAGLADTGGPALGLLLGGIVALGAGTVLLLRGARRP